MFQYFFVLCFFVIAECACPANYIDIDNHCFRFSKTPSKWDAAKATCQSDGADLAILNTCNLFGDVVNYILRNGLVVTDNTFYWIGARSSEGTVWLWGDSSQVEMGAPFWGSDADGVHQPNNGAALGNNDCAYLDPKDQYYFHDGFCDNQGWFICEMDMP